MVSRRLLAVAALFGVVGRDLPAQEPVTVIRAARVLDGTGRTIPNATVVVRGSRIITVAPNAPIPAGARAYDLSTLTLLPGLIDAPNHVVWQDRKSTRLNSSH